MRKLFIILPMLLLASRVDSSVHPLGLKVAQREIAYAITKLQPKIETTRAIKLATAIHRNASAIELDWRIAVAILYQESSLRMDPQNCIKRKDCNDMGIGQVRYSVWGKALNLDRKRLLTDETYAIDAVFQVLGHYKTQYGDKELNWFTRYHSKTPELRFLYMKRLNAAYHKINEAIE
jgi:hypothetical protein